MFKKQQFICKGIGFVWCFLTKHFGLLQKKSLISVFISDFQFLFLLKMLCHPMLKGKEKFAVQVLAQQTAPLSMKLFSSIMQSLIKLCLNKRGFRRFTFQRIIQTVSKLCFNIVTQGKHLKVWLNLTVVLTFQL